MTNGAVTARGWWTGLTAAPAADETALPGLSAYLQHYGVGEGADASADDLAEWATDYAAIVPNRPILAQIMLASTLGCLRPGGGRPAVSVTGEVGSGKTALQRALAAGLTHPSITPGQEALAVLKLDVDSEAASMETMAFVGEGPIWSDDLRRDQNDPEATRRMLSLIDRAITAAVDQAGGARFEGAGRTRRTDVLGGLIFSGEMLELNASRANRTISAQVYVGDLDQAALDAFRAKWILTGRANAVMRFVIQKIAEQVNRGRRDPFWGARRMGDAIAQETDKTRATTRSARAILEGVHLIGRLIRDTSDAAFAPVEWAHQVYEMERITDSTAASALVAEIRGLAGSASVASDPGTEILNELRDGIAAGRYYLNGADGAPMKSPLATACGWRWDGTTSTKTNEPIARYHLLPGAVEVGRISGDGRTVYLQAGRVPDLVRAAGVTLKRGAETDEALRPHLATGTTRGNVSWLRNPDGSRHTGFGYQVAATRLAIAVEVQGTAVAEPADMF